MRPSKFFGRLFVSAIVTTLGIGAASAQDLEDFTLSPEAAAIAKVRDEISLDTARQIADHCLENAASRGFGVSVVILSPAGYPVYYVRADGQGPVQVETALMKAETALYMRSATHAWMNRLIGNLDTAVRWIPLNKSTAFFNSGGLPIIVDDVMIGVVGAGGMPASAEWSDEICVHQAMTEVLGPQPPLAPFIE